MKATLIEDLKDFRVPICEGLNAKCPYVERLSDYLTAKGYRKASEVAEDIIRMLRTAGIDKYRYPVVAEIEEKYKEGFA